MAREMQEVELLEGAEPDAPVSAAAGPGRSRWWWVALPVSLVVIALVGVQLVLDARDRAAWERVADLPGVVRPLGDTLDVGPLDVEADLALTAANLRGAPAAYIVVAPDGSQTVTHTYANAPSWSTPVSGPDPRRASVSEGSMDFSRCVSSADDGGTVVCLVSDGYIAFSQDGYEQVPATTTKVVVIETNRGEIVAEWATGPANAVTTVPGLAILATTDESAGIVTVVAYAQLSGTERWRYVVPLTETDERAYWVMNGNLLTAGEVVVVQNDGSLTLLDAEGRFIRDDLGSPDSHVSSTDPSLVVSSMPSAGAMTTTVVAPDGDPASDRVYVGLRADPLVDDGSVPGLVLTVTPGSFTLAEQLGDERVGDRTGPGLHGYDKETGEELWFVPMAPFTAGMQPTSVIVLDERVYAASVGAAVTALDARTGTRLWSTDEPGTELGIVTDGRLVYARADRSADEGDRQLVGRSLDTGAEMWRAPLPDGIDALSVMDHTLLGMSFSTGEHVQLG